MNQPRIQLSSGQFESASFSQNLQPQKRSLEIPISLTASGECLIAPSSVNSELGRLMLSSPRKLSAISGAFVLTVGDQSRRATEIYIEVIDTGSGNQLGVSAIRTSQGRVIPAIQAFSTTA